MTTVTIPSAAATLLTVRGRSRVRVLLARILNRAARTVLAPAPYGPSPCCRREGLIPEPRNPASVFCSCCGATYPLPVAGPLP